MEAEVAAPMEASEAGGPVGGVASPAVVEVVSHMAVADLVEDAAAANQVVERLAMGHSVGESVASSAKVDAAGRAGAADWAASLADALAVQRVIGWVVRRAAVLAVARDVRRGICM